MIHVLQQGWTRFELFARQNVNCQKSYQNKHFYNRVFDSSLFWTKMGILCRYADQ